MTITRNPNARNLRIMRMALDILADDRPAGDCCNPGDEHTCKVCVDRTARTMANA